MYNKIKTSNNCYYNIKKLFKIVVKNVYICDIINI